MDDKEVRGAKRHHNARARFAILEKGMRATALLILEQLGEVESFDPGVREGLLVDIKRLVEVVQ